MKVAIYSTKPYDRQFLDEANAAERSPHALRYLAPRLDLATVALAGGCEAVSPFVNDQADANVLARLAGLGVKLIVLRGAGFNNVDLAAAGRLGITVARVPAYSPFAVAEHTIALILALNRKIHRACARVREGNFSIDGLLGFDLHGKTAGIVGTGRIGMALAQILNGFGCRLIASDPVPNAAFTRLGGAYVPIEELLASADIISLHCPLTPATRHLIDAKAVARMKRGVMLINTSRGAVVHTRALIDGLKSQTIGYLGLDVYEEEERSSSRTYPARS